MYNDRGIEALYRHRPATRSIRIYCAERRSYIAIARNDREAPGSKGFPTLGVVGSARGNGRIEPPFGLAIR